ncbi:hypothetical protein F5Y01DRAFT_270615 [Xylaria sp. FL0043]|nr:hypothetical protein F5Y01DRAFT_270615 [Xylaria sp. FL0043]
MQLKRKRSESELSTSTTSTFNSPPRMNFFPPQSTDIFMDTGISSFTAHFPVSPRVHLDNKDLGLSHNPGRTMKRLRDNRPSEHEVHRHTLDMLYAAQRQQTQRTGPATHQQHHVPIAVQPETSSSSTHQTSLHSFWNLPSRPSALTDACLPPVTMDQPTECEDCGQDLYADDEHMMMDVDDSTQTTSCGACGKHVCSHCSITNVGAQRRCLDCAGTLSRSGSGARSTASWTGGISSWLC